MLAEHQLAGGCRGGIAYIWSTASSGGQNKLMGSAIPLQSSPVRRDKVARQAGDTLGLEVCF